MNLFDEITQTIQKQLVPPKDNTRVTIFKNLLKNEKARVKKCLYLLLQQRLNVDYSVDEVELYKLDFLRCYECRPLMEPEGPPLPGKLMFFDKSFSVFCSASHSCFYPAEVVTLSLWERLDRDLYIVFVDVELEVV